MTDLEAIRARHSVRRYKDKPLDADAVEALRSRIREINAGGELHFQLVTEEPKAFSGLLAYGVFRGVRNYIIVAGKKSDKLDFKAGYYGEELVLLAQRLGLNTCWVGLNYRKVGGTYTLESGEKILCYIAVGYGETQGHSHKVKDLDEVSNAEASTPIWFIKGVQAALLAPSAINQQKFRFDYIAPAQPGDKAIVRATRKFSAVGYTKIDLGIAMRHFEIAAPSNDNRYLIDYH